MKDNTKKTLVRALKTQIQINTGQSLYRITLKRLRTVEDMKFWLNQLSEKGWFCNERRAAFISAACRIRGWDPDRFASIENPEPWWMPNR